MIARNSIKSTELFRAQSIAAFAGRVKGKTAADRVVDDATRQVSLVLHAIVVSNRSRSSLSTIELGC